MNEIYMNKYDFYHKKEFDDNEKEYNKKYLNIVHRFLFQNLKIK